MIQTFYLRMYSTIKQMDEGMAKVMPIIEKERPELFAKINSFLSTPIEELYSETAKAGFPNR